MNPDNQELKNRIARLENELAEIKQLLNNRDEGSVPEKQEPQITASTPPPIIARPWPEPQENLRLNRPQPQPSEPDKVRIAAAVQQPGPQEPDASEPDQPAPSSNAFEFKIGGLYLAYAGGLVVLLGMLYLVTLMISNRWISLEMQWGGELTFCAILAGLGLWKLNSRETVGQVLVGTGSCGAFLSFAGAHAYKGILSLDGLIAACVLLSLANFAFSEWRKSQVFYTFGILGGLSGAALALPDRIGLSQMLAAFVLIPAVIVVVRQQWKGMSVALWAGAFGLGFAGLACLPESNIGLSEAIYTLAGREAPASPQAFSWLNWGIFALFGLAATGAYLRVWQDEDSSATAYIEWIAPTTAALLPYAFLPNLASNIGFFAMLGLSLAFCALAQVAKSPKVREAHKLGALFCALVVPAFALNLSQASALYAMESLVLAVFWLQSRSKAYVNLAVVTGALGWCASVLVLAFRVSSPEVSLFDEILTTGAGLVIALAAVIVSWPNDEEYPQGWRSFTLFAAGAAGIRGLAELFYVLGMPVNATIVWATLAVIGLFAVGMYLTKVKEACGSFFALIPTFYVGLLLSADTVLESRTPEILLFVSFILFMALAAAAYARISEKEAGQAASLAAVAAIYPFGRLSYLAFTALGADFRSAVAIGVALFALICCAIANWRKWKELNWSGAIYALCAAMPLSMMGTEGVKPQPAAMAASLAVTFAFALAAYTAGRIVEKEKSAYAILGILACSLTFGRFWWLFLTGPGIELQSFQAMLVYLSIFTGGLAVFSIVRKWHAGAGISLFYVVLSVACYPAMKMPQTFLSMDLPPLKGGALADATALAMLIGSSLLAARALVPFAKEKRLVQIPFIGLEWALFSGMVMILAQQPPLGIKFDFSMSASWVIYGVALLTIGFIKNSSVFRISGLVVFSATLCKVFLYDLSYLETVVKIILLIGFGLVMLAISYAYSRFSKAQQKPEVPSQNELTGS